MKHSIENENIVIHFSPDISGEMIIINRNDNSEIRVDARDMIRIIYNLDSDYYGTKIINGEVKII